MADISTIVDQVHPVVSGVDIITSDTVWVVFDRAMDEDRLADNLFVAGPDNDTHTGPDHRIWIDFPSVGDEAEILQSPGYQGLVQGAFTYDRLDAFDNVVSGLDVVGSGLLYRSRVTFTPDQRLAPNTRYYVYLSGDESSTDGLDTGCSTRTVFDPIAGSNTGTTDPTFEGGYTGSNNDTYSVEILTTGTVGVATFRYRTTLFSTWSSAIKTRISGTLLRNGVTIKFPAGTWTDGDTWTVLAEPRDTFEGNMVWTFLTGSGSIQTVPTAASTSVLGDTIPSGVTTPSGLLEVSSTSPVSMASHQTLPDGPYTITATFDEAIDPATVVSGVTATVTATPVDGDAATHPASGVVISEPSVVGAVLTITVASGQLNDNNMVTVSIDDSIQGVTGSQMSADYEWWFTTEYTPYYCTLQKIKLEVGAYIPGVRDDTINFAIQQASIAAEALTWSTTATSTFYQWVRSQWTCCKAQEIVLLNAMQSQDKLKSKRLGDLAVEYNIGDNDALDRALACLDRWEKQLQAGGQKNKITNPSMVVKGDLDPDRPPIGRRWGYSSGGQAMPLANTRWQGSNSRRHKSTYSRSYRGKKRYDR